MFFCNSIFFLLVELQRGGSFRLMRGAQIGDLIIRSQFFCIITSLASGGVVVLPGFVIVVESCGVVSIVETIGAHGVGERSSTLVCLVPVSLLVVLCCWGSLILLWAGLEAF